MKKLIFILFLLPLLTFGQNRFPSIDSAKNYVLRYVKNSAVESFTNLRMQNVTYGTLQLIDSLCGSGVIDTIWKSGDTLKYRIGTQTVVVGVFSSGGSTTDTTSLSNRINLKLNISDTSSMLSPYLRSNVAAATYQPIGNYLTTGSNGSLQSLNVTGTNGNGHIHLRHQSSLPTATAQSTVIYANSDGDFAYKNDGNYHTTFVTSANTADRSYTFQNKSYTVADNAEVMKYIDTVSLSNRINAIASGIQWTGVDSAFALNSATKGYHEVADFGYANGVGLLTGSSTFYSPGANVTSIGVQEVGTNSVTRLSTSTSATGFGAVYHFTPFLTISADWMLTEFRVKIPALNDGTERFYIQIGLFDAATTLNIANGIAFYYMLNGDATSSASSGNWQTVTANGSSRTFTTTSTTVTADSWVKLRILATSTAVYFYINGNLVATHTSNIPSTNTFLMPQFHFRKTLGSTSRSMLIDYFTCDIKYGTAK